MPSPLTSCRTTSCSSTSQSAVRTARSLAHCCCRVLDLLGESASQPARTRARPPHQRAHPAARPRKVPELQNRRRARPRRLRRREEAHLHRSGADHGPARHLPGRADHGTGFVHGAGGGGDPARPGERRSHCDLNHPPAELRHVRPLRFSAADGPRTNPLHGKACWLISPRIKQDTPLIISNRSDTPVPSCRTPPTSS